MHLIVNHVMQFDDVDDTHGSFLVETLPCFTIIQVCMAKVRKLCLSDQVFNFLYRSTIKYRCSELKAQLFTRPSEDSLIYLPEVHTRWYTKWVQYNVNRCTVFQEWHIFFTYYLGNDTLVTVTTRHLITHLQLTLAGKIYFGKFQYARW